MYGDGKAPGGNTGGLYMWSILQIAVRDDGRGGQQNVYCFD